MLTDAPLTFEFRQGNSAETLIYALTGPLTLRNMFDLQAALRRNKVTRLTILDLSGVPYMDSAGMGLVMNQYVHCQTNGGRLVLVGTNNRVMELFRITKIDGVVALAASVAEAESQAH